MNLNVDLQRGVIPISKAASSLAALIKRTGTTGQPVIITQKGYPTGVLLPIGMFSALKDMAEHQGEPEPELAPETADAIADALPEDAAANDNEEIVPAAERPAPRRRKAGKAEVVA
jgi:prevent-host-death family protein